ncbi:unnamed protein product [Protopolystoma xenopodis]|uniref:Tetraspanin n=1 Tax=Protopolystoma xenopodis TaxID=117903 RepID=A0A448WDY3_9PLAT|nr:unnamed protein product [Protopolystoma xenopodis]
MILELLQLGEDSPLLKVMFEVMRSLSLQVSITFWVLGFFIVIVSMFGMYSAYKPELAVFLVSIMLQMVLFALLILVLRMYANQEKAIEAFVMENIKKILVSNYKMNSDEEDLTTSMGFQVLWDELQTRYNCCGVFSYKDYENTSDFNPLNGMVPYSCCLNASEECIENPQNSSDLILRACSKPLWDEIRPKIVIGIYCMIPIVVYVFILIILSFIVCCQTVDFDDVEEEDDKEDYYH